MRMQEYDATVTPAKADAMLGRDRAWSLSADAVPAAVARGRFLLDLGVEPARAVALLDEVFGREVVAAALTEIDRLAYSKDELGTTLVTRLRVVHDQGMSAYDLQVMLSQIIDHLFRYEEKKQREAPDDGTGI